MTLIKKYVSTFLLTAFICATSHASYGVSQHHMHNLCCLIKLHPEISDKLVEQATESKKEVILDIIKKIETHQELSLKELQIISQMIGNPTSFDDPESLLKQILNFIGLPKAVHTNKREDTFHTFVNHSKISHAHSSKSEHFLTLYTDKKKTLQESANQLVKETRKKEQSYTYVSLDEVLEKGFALPKEYRDKLLTAFVEYRTFDKELKELKKNARNKKEAKEIKKEIKAIRKERHQVLNKIRRFCKNWSLPQEEIEWMIKDQDEIRLNEQTQTLQTCAEVSIQKNINTFGPYLVVNRYHEYDSSLENYNSGETYKSAKISTPHDTYAYESLKLKNYGTEQIIEHTLDRFLKVTIDEKTGEPIYLVYYQEYNEKKNRYLYYQYTPTGIKRIKEKAFFQQSQQEQTSLIVYKRSAVYTFNIPIPWYEPEMLKQVKNVFSGAFIALAIVAYNTNKYVPSIKDLLSSPSYTTEVYKNTGNSCYLNTVLKFTEYLYPDMWDQLDEVKYPKVSTAIKNIQNKIAAVKANPGKPVGVTSNDMEKFRNALNDIIRIPAVFTELDNGEKVVLQEEKRLWESTTTQEDPEEFIRAIDLLGKEVPIPLDNVPKPQPENPNEAQLLPKCVHREEYNRTKGTTRSITQDLLLIVQLKQQTLSPPLIDLLKNSQVPRFEEDANNVDSWDEYWTITLAKSDLPKNDLYNNLLIYLAREQFKDCKKQFNEPKNKKGIQNVRDDLKHQKTTFEQIITDNKKRQDPTDKKDKLLKDLFCDRLTKEQRRNFNTGPSAIKNAFKIYEYAKNSLKIDITKPLPKNYSKKNIMKLFTDQGVNKNLINKKLNKKDGFFEINFPANSDPQIRVITYLTLQETFKLTKDKFIVQLKRFGPSGGGTKITTKVPNVMNLTLEPNMVKDGLGTEAELVACIIHAGTGATNGHYITLLKKRKKWFGYDDMATSLNNGKYVTERSWEDVKKLVESDGYLLGYKLKKKAAS